MFPSQILDNVEIVDISVKSFKNGLMRVPERVKLIKVCENKINRHLKNRNRMAVDLQYSDLAQNPLKCQHVSSVTKYALRW